MLLSHFRRTPTCASGFETSGIGPPSHSSIGAQRYMLLTQVPFGRTRITFPSVARRKRIRVVIPTVFWTEPSAL